jgi:hypothetical protein
MAIPPVDSAYSLSPSIIAEAIYGMAEGARDSVTSSEIRQVIKSIDSDRIQAQKQGFMPMRHATHMRRFMRYQRKAAASISKAVCHSDNIHPSGLRSSFSTSKKIKK